MIIPSFEILASHGSFSIHNKDCEHQYVFYRHAHACVKPTIQSMHKANKYARFLIAML